MERKIDPIDVKKHARQLLADITDLVLDDAMETWRESEKLWTIRDLRKVVGYHLAQLSIVRDSEI